MALQSLYTSTNVLMPYENIAIFASADDEALVRTPKRRAYDPVTSRVPNKLLEWFLGCEVDQLSFAISLVDEQVFRILADAD